MQRLAQTFEQLRARNEPLDTWDRVWDETLRVNGTAVLSVDEAERADWARALGAALAEYGGILAVVKADEAGADVQLKRATGITAVNRDAIGHQARAVALGPCGTAGAPSPSRPP